MNRQYKFLLKLTLAAALVLPLGSTRLTASSSEDSPISLDRILRPIIGGSESAFAKTKESEASEKSKSITYEILDENQMMSHLAKAMSGNLEAGDKLELSCKAKMRSVRIPSNATWIVYTEDELNPDTRGNWFPMVVLEVNGEKRNSWRLPLKVALYRTVHMAAQRLDRGDSPKSPGVKPVESNIYDHRGNPIPATVDLSGYELVQPVAEGRLISWNDVARRPDVRKGDMVDVLLEKGSLSINIVALSLDSGVIGQTVSLRNVRSRQEFSGVVSGARRVQVIN